MGDVEKKYMNHIKEFIQTFCFAKNVEIIMDESNLKTNVKTHKENNCKVINIYSCYAIWLCMNEIYPSWFDISIHPAQFETEIDAYECLLKYINEYHEKKYEKITKQILDKLSALTINEFIDIYSLIILAALVSDDKQKHINNILSVSHETQKYIHNVVELLDKEESDNEEKGLSEQNSKDNAIINESLKTEIKQLKEKVKYFEMENDNLNNSITEKNKIIEEDKEKMSNLQKQINAECEKTKNQYMNQIEEHEKKINELQNNLEKQMKDKLHIENDLKNKIKELEDEQNILKQENANIDILQNKINTYKEKLESMMTIQNINKELEDKLKENTQKMVDMEGEMEKLKIETTNIKIYKDKCADLDADLVNMKTENEKLKQELSEKNKIVQQLKNDLDMKTHSYDMLKKEQNMDNINIGLSNVDQTEELIRIKKENENLRKQIGSYSNEDIKKLENEIDDLKRINEKLEQKFSENKDKENINNDQKLQEKYNKSLNDIEDKKKEIEEQQQKIDEQEKLINDKQQKIDEQEKLINEKQQKIDEQEKQFEHKKKEVDEKQKLVDEKQKLVDEKQNLIDEIQKEIKNKQNEIDDKKKTIEKKKKKIEEKQKEIEQITEANRTLQMQLSSNQGSSDQSLNEKLIRLEAELLMEKKNTEQIEETTKNKLSKEFNTALQIFKEQLQIREKETEYYKDALKKQIDTTNDEQKLLSDIIHNLGLKYKQLQTYNLSLRNEITGIKLRAQTCAEYEKK
ncbi:conserved Plasmodium protein, unknown function [Plasmodium sp. gorilla clade G2]|uniref:conserved Plasmodium protein, unknown function n=1 Tax=Plasmodium sp. gorilla clade G2 TaxID=880535 RepID=UPI000D2245BF|nr:conserved Plasmodium protein, unknown function [Plasmodium sp. gorilla clade G2]SOV13932.1 conserved Plasmodium protein, unknown function [Plasmodium sp. gorilla clade G2]